LEDLETIRNEIRENYSSSSDVIYKRSGSYSVESNAQEILLEGINEFQNFIYVVDIESKRSAARYATETYMRKYNTRIADT